MSSPHFRALTGALIVRRTPASASVTVGAGAEYYVIRRTPHHSRMHPAHSACILYAYCSYMGATFSSSSTAACDAWTVVCAERPMPRHRARCAHVYAFRGAQLQIVFRGAGRYTTVRLHCVSICDAHILFLTLSLTSAPIRGIADGRTDLTVTVDVVLLFASP